MRDSKASDDSRLELFQAAFGGAFGLPVAFSASVEGSIIEMEPVTLSLEDTAVSLKAYIAR